LAELLKWIIPIGGVKTSDLGDLVGKLKGAGWKNVWTGQNKVWREHQPHEWQTNSLTTIF
jgi:hypothetical protein